MKQSKGYRLLALIHSIIGLVGIGAMIGFSILDMGDWAMGSGIVGVAGMLSAMCYDNFATHYARREWRSIK
jgi:hypothetical protein